MADNKQRYRARSGQQRGTRHMAASMTRPNLVSLIIALGVIGLLVVLFPLDWVARPSVNVALDQSAFSPDGDGTQDEIAAFYTLSEQAEVSALVRNSAGIPVRALVNRQPQGDGQHALTWDGRDDGGQLVPDGLYQIVVSAAGTARGAEHSVPVEVDTTPPKLQLANLPEDLTTREPSLTIEGTTDPNVTVLISGDPRPIPVDARGIFRSERILDEGLNPVDIRAIDAAGNESLLSRLVTLRTQPPQLALESPAENNLFVSANLLPLRGQVPPDVAVTVNGREATVNAEGQFTLDVLLDEGENVLRIVAQDEVGNQSTMERRVTLRSEGPTIALTSVPDGLVVRDPSLRISGRVDPGAQLQVNGNTVPVDANGNFSTLVALQGGNNLISVTASDVAGNASTVQRTVHYATGRSGSPEAPAIRAPTLPDDPLVWQLLVGLGLLAGALFLFGAFASPIAFDLTVDYPVFYPNRPHEQRMLIMRLSTTRSAKVTLEVYDEFNRHVATLMDNKKVSQGEHFRLWDGRNSVGQLMQGGSYLVQASARTPTNTATSAVWVRLDPSRSALVGATTRQSRDQWVDEEQIIDVS